MSDTRIVEIGGKRYWVGLEWEVIAQSERPKERIKELRKEFGAAGIQFMHRQQDSGVVSVGYARIEGGYRKAPSLAAIIAHAKREPWMGLFRISDDLWWYIAVREGQSVIPGGDVIGTREEVEAARSEHQGIGDWRYSLEGQIADVLDMISEGLSQASGVGAPVKPMVTRIPAWVGLLGLALLALLAGLLFLHHVHQQRRLQREAQERAAKIAAFRNKLAAKRRLLENLKPWVGAKPVGAILAGCEQSLLSLPVELRGWAPKSLVCLPNGSGEVVWKRAPYGLALIAPPGRLQPGGNSIIESVEINVGNTKRDAQTPLSVPQLMRRLYGLSQFAGEAIHFAGAAGHSRPPLPGARGNKRPKRSARPYRMWKIIVDASAFHEASAPQGINLLGKIPTMRVDKIVISNLPANPVWKASLRVWSKQ
jgi:hypothetical protein